MGERHEEHQVSTIVRPPERRALVQDFDGDGRADILWYADGESATVHWSDGRDTFSKSRVERIVHGSPFAGDFDGDGAGDVFWYQPGADNHDEVWFGGRSREFFVDRDSAQVTGNYKTIVGDFDGNGRAEIIWDAFWRRSDFWAGLENRRFLPTGTVVPGQLTSVVGDFDADGDDDIFWYVPLKKGDRARGAASSGRSSTP